MPCLPVFALLLPYNFEWQTCNTATYSDVTYTVYGNDYQFAIEEFPKATRLLEEYAAGRGLEITSCRQIYNLEIYQTPTAIISRKEISGLDYEIWGLYYPPDNNLPDRTAAILLSKHKEDWNKRLLYHEIAHFWFDKSCWADELNISSERFAMDFEKFYVNQQPEI